MRISPFVIPLLQTAISERFRGAARDEALYKSTFTLLYFDAELELMYYVIFSVVWFHQASAKNI